MESESKTEVVVGWLFMFSAIFAAGLALLVAAPMVKNFFNRRRRGACGCQAPINLAPDESIVELED